MANGRQALYDALKTFTFSLSQGLAAQSQAPGRRGSQMGMAAAFGAPQIMQEMEAKRVQQEQQAAQQKAQFEEMIRRGRVQDAVTMLGINPRAAEAKLPDYTNAVQFEGMAPEFGAPPVQQGGTFEAPLPPIPVPLASGTINMPQTSHQQMDRDALAKVFGTEQARSMFQPPPAAASGFSLSPGQTRFGPDGQPLANVPATTPSVPTTQGFSLSPGQTRFDSSGKQIANVPAAPQASTATPQEAGASGLAQAVLRDPSILRTLTPSDRGKVYAELGKSGQIPNTRFSGVVDRAIDTIALLKTAPGKAGAVGAKGPSSLFGAINPIAGTDAGDYTALLEQLKALVVLPDLELMRGLGAMSDRELLTLTSAATTLSRNLSEKAFDDEVTRIEKVFTDIKSRMTNTPTKAPSGVDSAVWNAMTPEERALWQN